MKEKIGQGPSLVKVLGYIAVKDLGCLEDRVRVLAQLGYGNAEIADICGATLEEVSKLRRRASRVSGNFYF